ncbi:hypothetical protein DAERI_030284 [Deinococcus aerius]|uniref:Uncharacterized protein n=1 Tax=Deinococcus aerius TaxID=200253 RepID=A0A2I9DG78_9DEIO|nr:hypothetical protein DAERI_030284 [Deinococcus aerius]
MGQVWFIVSAQAGQKMHSKEQMVASPSGARETPQRSQADFISSMYRAYGETPARGGGSVVWGRAT